MTSQQYASMPVPMEEEDIDDALMMDPAVNKPWMSQRKMFTLIVGMAVAGTALVASFSANSSKTMYGARDQVAAISQLQSEDPCAGFPQIQFAPPSQSNLANVKSSSSPEGIIFPGKYIDPKKTPPFEMAVKVVVNALPPSNKADTTTSNGIWGKYAGIAVKGGKKMHLKFSIKDHNDDPVILRELDLTFFDIDRHTEEGDVEYVKLWNRPKYILTNAPLMKVTNNDTEGSFTFAAIKDGTGHDNPKDPLFLTAEQKHKAVTVQYLNTDHFEAEVGSTGHKGGHIPRGFIFVFRPSLLCAGGDPVPTVGPPTTTTTTMTTTTVATTTAGDKEDCLFIVPVINFCFPKFWKSWFG